MKKNNFLLFKKFGRNAKYLLINALNILFYFLKTLTDKQKIKYTAINTVKKFSSFSARFGFAFRRLNYKGRILLIFFSLLIIALTVNLTLLKKKNLETEKEKIVQDLSALIEQKQNQAEANLLYSNENGASQLFTEIADLLEQYPQETEGQKQQLSAFREKFEAQLDKIRRVTKISDPLRLTDFSELNSRARPDNIIYFDKNKRLYAADAADKSVYILNTADKLVTTLTDLNQPILELSYPVAGADDEIYYFNKNALTVLDTQKETLTGLVLELTQAASGYAGAAVYSDRYYLLSAEGRILRFTMAGGKVSSPTDWLQENIDFGRALSLSIDGNIYVLKESGEVIKLLRGRKVDFKLDPVDPPFSQPAKIFVSPEQNFIYILEPANRRLVLFDKEGQFLRQYQMPGLENIKDFFVDEQNMLIYLLDSSSVYNIVAEHLNE